MAPPTIIIATIDQTRSTRAYSVRYEYSLGARARAELEIVDDDSTETALRPQIDQRLELRHGAVVLFRGKILSVSDKPLGDPGVGTVTGITAVDDWAVAALRRVSEFYGAGQTLRNVVTDLVAKYLAVYGLTLGAWPVSSPNGPTLPALTWDGVTVEDAFNQLVDLTGGWVYRLNPTGEILWFGQAHRIEGVVFSAANKNILGALTWTKTRVQHANRVIVRYGTGLVGGGQTFTGNGTQTRFDLTFPVAQVGHLTYQGGPYPPGKTGIELVGLDSSTPRPWYVDAAAQQLVRQLGAGIPGGVAAAPAAGDIVKFYYNIQFPQVASAETAEAATYPIEAIVERADIFNEAQAQAVAQTQLEKLTDMPRLLTLRSRLPGTEQILPGDALQVDVPSRTLPLTAAPLGWLVTETQVTIDVDQEPTTTFTLLEASGGALLLSWLNFWRDVVGAGAGVGIATGSTMPPPHTTTSPPPGETSTGDVGGPVAATDNAVARFDGISGKLIQNSILLLGDTGILSGATFPAGGLKVADVVAGDLLVGTAPQSLSRLAVGNPTQVLQVAQGGAPIWATVPTTGYTPGGPDVAVSDGGTGISSYAVGDLLYATHPTTLSRLAAGANGEILWSSAGLPVWAPAPETGAGSGGDVVGPAGSTDRAIPVFDGLTGKLLANTTTAKISPTGDLFVSGLSQFEGQVFAKALLRADIGVTIESGDCFIRTGLVNTAQGTKERGRTALMGDWIDVPYSAANFTTNTAAVWTVDAGDVITYRYTLIGNTLILAFELGPTSLNVATQQLRIALPAGVVAAKQTRTLSQMYSSGIVGAATIVSAPAAGYVACSWYGTNFTAANWAASTNNTYVQGQIVVPI